MKANQAQTDLGTLDVGSAQQPTSRAGHPRIRAFIGATAAALFLAAGLSAAQPAYAQRQGPAREQKTPSLVYMTNPDARNRTEQIDSYFMAWVEDRGSGADLYGKRLFQNGLAQGGPDKQGIQILRQLTGPGRNDPPGERADPDMVYNAQRQEIYVVFSEFKGEPDGWDIYAVRVAVSGYAKGNPRLIAGGPGDQQHPDVAILNDDRGGSSNEDYVVVFDDNTRDLDEIKMVRVRENGIQRGAATTLFAGEAWNATDPTTNGQVVAWVDDRDADSEIWAIRLRNGIPNGEDYRLAGTDDDDFAPNFGTGSLVWNVYDAASGADIVGVQVYPNQRTRGPNLGIVVPAADQSWPVIANGLLLWSDNRDGQFDLYAMRTVNVRSRGREYAVLTDR